MGDSAQPISLFSPRTARALWVIGVTLGVFVLALNFWGWAHRGYSWTTFLGPVGMLLLVAGYPVVRSRPKLYLVFQVVGIILLIASTVLILRSLGRL